MRTIRFSIAALLCLVTVDAMAGGLFTNTNQNPVFLRQPAQNAIVGIQGVYYNPAGVALMEKGWHFYVGDQMAIQSREITSTYEPFRLGAKNNGSATKNFNGYTFAPLIPNIDVAYSHGRWAAQFHLGIISGGGSCTFENGLGSFEAPLALLPTAVNTLGKTMGMTYNIFSGYDTDISFTGKSFGIGAQLNFAYKVVDTDMHKLSLAAGVRMNYLRNSYSGGIYGYSLGMGGKMYPATDALYGILTQFGLPSEQAKTYAQAIGGKKEVKCVQTDFAWTPILSLHYRVSIVDIAVKYEFNTKVRLKNSTDVNSANIEQFKDGEEVAADIPALLSAGVNVNILPSLRASLGYHLYFDKNAKYGNNNRQDLLGSNTWEGLAGVEWDINKKFTVSMGGVITRFDFGENNNYLNDMSFSLSNWSLGGGARYNINEHFAIDLSVFNTFYEHATKTYADYGNAGATYAKVLKQVLPTIPQETLDKLKVPGQDEFYRTSLTFGLGLQMKF